MARKKTPARKVLRHCAALLYAQTRTAQNATTQRRLHGGLVLTLTKRGSNYQALAGGEIHPTQAYYVLSLTRKDVWPSNKEAEICRAVFDVPQSALPSQDIQGDFHIVRFRWAQGREKLILWISQAHLEPGVGLHRWQRIMDRHQLFEPKDWNRFGIEELKQIKAEIQEVSNQWIHNTQPQP